MRDRIQEIGLAYAYSVVCLSDCNDRETHFLDPRVHDSRDAKTGGGLNTLPEVLRYGITVEMILQVDRDSFEEFLFTDIIREHTHHYV